MLIRTSLVSSALLFSAQSLAANPITGYSCEGTIELDDQTRQQDFVLLFEPTERPNITSVSLLPEGRIATIGYQIVFEAVEGREYASNGVSVDTVRSEQRTLTFDFSTTPSKAGVFFGDFTLVREMDSGEIQTFNGQCSLLFNRN